MKATIVKFTILAGAVGAFVSGHAATLGIASRSKTCGS